MQLLRVVLAVGLAAALSTPAFCQGRTEPIRIYRLSAPVSVDGILDDAPWNGAPTFTQLTQNEPDEGAAPTESTSVWVAFDDEALYVAALCLDARPDSIVANLVRRDLWTVSDRIVLFLDPYHDGRSGYFFSVSAAGVLWDGTLYNDDWSDDTWDGVWDGRAHVDDRGWTAEMRIPFSQLRYRSGSGQTWGFNFRRRIERRTELDELIFKPRDENRFVSRFVELVGLDIGRRPSAIEIVPYTTGKAEYLVRDAGDPFNDGSRYTSGLGGDLRMGVGSNLTLNATVNPDFGQVEVDPAVVNLSDVESFFEEKRPFFTENSRVFSFGHEGANDYWGFNFPEATMFYSRRIGRAPQGCVPDDADFCDVPMATDILGAAKLTGKLGPRMNFGTLHALTSREEADYALPDGRFRTEVEPPTYYGMVRGLNEFEGGHNGLGGMATLIQRRFRSDALEDALNRQSLMAGLDGWHFLDRKKLWVLSGYAAMSRVAGNEQRMIDLQRSSRHYMQRPDVDHLGVDSSATSLTGYSGRLWLHKQEGSLLFNSALGFISPKFDVNDMGYQGYSDLINGHLGTGYLWAQANSWRKRAWVITSVFRSLNFDGTAVNSGLYVGSSVTFASDYNGNLEGIVSPETRSDRQTRGGPLMVRPRRAWGHAHMDTDRKDRISWCFNLEAETTPDAGSRAWSFNPTMLWTPATNFSFQFGPGYEHVIEGAQYVARQSDPDHVPDDFGGHRYVFARLDQRTISASIRLDVSFTPNLSLRTYIQPLISAGRYSGYKELARASSYDFVVYGRDGGSTYDAATGMVDPDGPGPAAAFEVEDPSFNYKSLRGSAVLRWEYRPGSVLFVAWTQDRSDEEAFGDLRFGPSVDRLLDRKANNIFLTKLTYYLNL